jgi:uncharacterized protein (DUF169 family)
MNLQETWPEVNRLLESLGMHEVPMGMHYSEEAPSEGVSPKPGILPSVEMEARREIDWSIHDKNWSCVVGQLWIARHRQSPAYFDRERFGCLGGAFYLGFLKPQLETIACYISTGIPGQLEGERYLESPEISHKFFETLDPRPAPARYCVFKPLNQFTGAEVPEVVVFFARPEVVSGLHQLATFVTNDFEAVCSPFGAGCSNIVTWPIKYKAQGKLKAVLGAWDPSARKYLNTDEITFAVPLEMFDRMLQRWSESFLTTNAWKTVLKRVEKSRKNWGED